MYNRILGPLDGSKLSECSLEHIKIIASGCGISDVILLAVLEPVAVSSLQYSEWSSRKASQELVKQWQEVEKEQRQKAQDYLNKSAAELKGAGIHVEPVVISSSIDKGVAEIILDYARDNNVDLIIMSTHGRSGVSRFAFGSVADKVIRHANIPVMTVVPAGCRKTN